MKIVNYMIAPFVIAMAIALSAFAPLACSSPQVRTGGVAAGACVLDDVMKYAGQVEAALATETFKQALADVATKNNLTQDAVTCLVQTVLAVLAPSGGPTTGQESPTVLHARQYLSEQGK